MAKKKRRHYRMSGERKLVKKAANLAASGMIALPAVVPLFMIGKEVVAGHTLSYAVNSATNNIAGVMPLGDTPDLSVDFGKVTKYAVGSAMLVALGVGMKKYLVKRI